MIDYHIHLERGPYNVEWLLQFWDQAQRRGITEIGITEHAHEFREFLPVYEHLWKEAGNDPGLASWIRRHFQHSIEDYLELLGRGGESGIFLKVGMEVDYFPQSEGKIRSLLSSYDFDFVLGSVHFLDDWSFDWDPEIGWPGRNSDAVYLEYLSILEKMVKSRLFDIAAHLDVIKVFGHRPKQNLDREWHDLLVLMLQSNLALEVNTAGLRKPVGEIYPHPMLIAEAARLGIPITIASDAHMPLDVGDRWEEAVALACNSGFRKYCTFTDRQPTSHDLPLL